MKQVATKIGCTHPRFYGERKKRRKVNKVHPWNLENDWFKPKAEHILNPRDACVHSWVDACSCCHQVPWVWAPEHRETQEKDLKGYNLCFVNHTCWRVRALYFLVLWCVLSLILKHDLFRFSQMLVSSLLVNTAPLLHWKGLDGWTLEIFRYHISFLLFLLKFLTLTPREQQTEMWYEFRTRPIGK